MLACAAMLISWLTVHVPVGFFPQPMVVEDVAPVAGPPGAPAVRVSHLRFVSDSGPGTIDVTVFDGLSPTPGGPMQIAGMARVTVDGQPLDVIRTSMFMGELADVAVAYPVDPAGVGAAMIVVRDLDFEAALDLVPQLLAGC